MSHTAPRFKSKLKTWKVPSAGISNSSLISLATHYTYCILSNPDPNPNMNLNVNLDVRVYVLFQKHTRAQRYIIQNIIHMLFTFELFEPFELFLVPTLIPFLFLFLLTESRTPDQLPEDEIPFQVIPFRHQRPRQKE